MKRRQRAGLPIYPQEIQDKAAAAFHLHQHHKRPQNQISPSPPAALLITSQNPAYNNASLSAMFNSFNFQSPTNLPLQNQAPGSCLSNPNNHAFQLFFDSANANAGGFSLPPYHPPSSTTSLMNENIQTQTTMQMPPFKVNSPPGNHEMSFSAMISQPIDFGTGLESELPSNQIPAVPKQASAPASSGSSGGVCAVGISSTNDNNNDYQISQKTTCGGNSGLLDDLVQESNKISSNEKFKGQFECFSDAGDKGKSVVDASSADEEVNEGVESMMANAADNNNQWDDFSSSQSSIGEIFYSFFLHALDRIPLIIICIIF